ncbi:MAG: hypothetical protein K2N04_07315 [Alistipes sp.]|nr:hypothetical protein [Alistipes sp.]
MNSFYMICAAIAAAAAGVLLAMLLVETLRRRRELWRNDILRRRYLHIVMFALYADDGAVPRFPMLRRAGVRLLLAETLAGVAAMTCGLDMTVLRRIVKAYGLDSWLLRRARRAQGYRRARYLALLASLPVDGAVAARVVRYGTSRNRSVRFQALLVRLAAEPMAVLRLLAEYAWPLTEAETAQIMALLRRGVLPVAYEPLVTSPSGNLRRVGLHIVRQFGIEEAEPLLLRMLADARTPELDAEALRTLCALRRPLIRREVRECVARMSASERRALIRCMVRENYSPRFLRRIFDDGECGYYETMVTTYKRCLA